MTSPSHSMVLAASSTVVSSLLQSVTKPSDTKYGRSFSRKPCSIHLGRSSENFRAYVSIGQY